MPRKTKNPSSPSHETCQESGGSTGAAPVKRTLRHVGSGGHALAVDPDRKIDNLHRLRRIEGQIRGLQDMVRQDRYCADILIQVAAVQKSLASVARQVLANHLKHCVSQNIRAGGAQADAACEELLKLMSHMDR